MTHGIKTWTFEFHVIPGRGVPDYEDQHSCSRPSTETFAAS